MVVITGRANPRFRRRSVKLAQRMDEAWRVPRKTHVIGALIQQAFRAHGLSLPNACVTRISMDLQTALFIKTLRAV
ncbi:MAG: hypothetical protein ACKVQU_12925, partial [Burkholderiales bacterium]